MADKRRNGLTKQDKTAPKFPELLKRDFTAAAPNRKWVGDMTEIPTESGQKLYLATVAHRLPNPQLPAQLGERICGISTAAVGVEYDPLGLVVPPDRLAATTVSHRHLDRRARQLSIGVQAHSRPQQPAAIEVEQRVSYAASGLVWDSLIS